MRVAAIVAAALLGALCGLVLVLPVHAQESGAQESGVPEPRPGGVVIIRGTCSAAVSVDLGLAGEGFHVVARALSRDGLPMRTWRRPDGEWRTVLYAQGAEGPMACLAGQGTRLAIVVGEGA